jgi:hypothetical protein
MSGTEPANASLIGPFNEGTVITLLCMSGGGKPAAGLEWFNSSAPLQGKYQNFFKNIDTRGVSHALNAF